MSDEEKRGFVFHSSNGEAELSIEEVKELASRKDPDGLYALGMAYLYGWDIEGNEECYLDARLPQLYAILV